MASNYEDASLIREKVTADIFRDAGVKAAQTSFYRIYIDHGSGPKYFGLYTAVEVVDDTMLDTQFGSKEGNCYKPDGSGATLSTNGFNTSDFEKKTNEDEADWSDINALYETLHSNDRLSNPETWRSQLEQVLDVEVFLNWLAINTTIQNWDTYGKMTHNFYLYNNPATGKLNWIPWDNNEALYSGRMGGALSFSMDELGEQWPLISFLLEDEVYHAKYKEYIQKVAEGAFKPERINAIYQQNHSLIAPYVTGSEGEVEGYTFLQSSADFSNALNELMSHSENRYNEAMNFVK